MTWARILGCVGVGLLASTVGCATSQDHGSPGGGSTLSPDDPVEGEMGQVSAYAPVEGGIRPRVGTPATPGPDGVVPTAASGGTEQVGQCVRTRSAPVYQGLGWTHFVDVRNDCSRPVGCDVATSIDPEPTYRIELPSGQQARVRVRYGSNWPTYEPRVACAWAN